MSGGSVANLRGFGSKSLGVRISLDRTPMQKRKNLVGVLTNPQIKLVTSLDFFMAGGSAQLKKLQSMVAIFFRYLLKITQYREYDQMSCIFAFSRSLPKLDMTFISDVSASVELYDALQIT